MTGVCNNSWLVHERAYEKPSYALKSIFVEFGNRIMKWGDEMNCRRSLACSWRPSLMISESLLLGSFPQKLKNWWLVFEVCLSFVSSQTEFWNWWMTCTSFNFGGNLPETRLSKIIIKRISGNQCKISVVFSTYLFLFCIPNHNVVSKTCKALAKWSNIVSQTFEIRYTLFFL